MAFSESECPVNEPMLTRKPLTSDPRYATSCVYRLVVTVFIPFARARTLSDSVGTKGVARPLLVGEVRLILPTTKNAIMQ